ncbi:MAG: DUF2281 domain-containing protein [Deferrisomatales bacterium]
MNLAEEIQAHVQVLPPMLQKETLDFIGYLEGRYGIAPPVVPASASSTTEEFINRHAGVLGDDFPDDIDDSDLGVDVPRDSLE